MSSDWAPAVVGIPAEPRAAATMAGKMRGLIGVTPG
jgi:hypothetical protein